MTSTMDLVHSYVSEYPNDTCGAKERAALEKRIKELEQDAKRYRFLLDNCTGEGEDGQINIDYTCSFECYDDLDKSIDRAMSDAALQKLVDISQEYKLP